MMVIAFIGCCDTAVLMSWRDEKIRQDMSVLVHVFVYTSPSLKVVGANYCNTQITSCICTVNTPPKLITITNATS